MEKQLQVLVSQHRFESLVFGNAKDANSAVVYLHGAGEFGSGATGQFERAGLATLLYKRDIRPALPVIIACALDGERYQIDALTAYLDELKAEFNLTQIHILAYSRGGLAAYELAERQYPLASATIINSNCPLPAAHYQCLGPISHYACPLHIIQSDEDQRVDVNAVDEFVEQYDGELIYTRWHGDHFVIAEVLRDDSLWQWMLSETATDPSW